LLLAAAANEPLPWLTPTHTLIHLDGIALGSLLALAIHTSRSAAASGSWIGLGALSPVFQQPPPSPEAPRFLIPRLAVGFAGAVLALIASTGARNPLNAALRSGPLAFYGRISYGLYMIHIMVFIYFGWFDLRMNRYGMAGNLAVVAFRLAASTAVATALWYGFESQILKLKRYF
jgi:peptidoglycan/LPS O-acetylase OafA/YrhL